MKKLLLLIVLGMSLFSCYNTRIYMGNTKPQDPVVEVNRRWNSHFLYGLIPARNSKMVAADYVDNASNYVVRTNTNFVNGLVSVVTFGIYTPTQTIYYMPVRDMKK